MRPLADCITNIILATPLIRTIKVVYCFPPYFPGGKMEKLGEGIFGASDVSGTVSCFISPWKPPEAGYLCSHFSNEEFEIQRANGVGCLLHYPLPKGRYNPHLEWKTEIPQQQSSTVCSVSGSLGLRCPWSRLCYGGSWALQAASLLSTPHQSSLTPQQHYCFPFSKNLWPLQKSGSPGNQATKFNLLMFPTQVGTESSKFPDKYSTAWCLSNLKV